MDSPTAFKHEQHYYQQHNQLTSSSCSTRSNNSSNSIGISSHNNNNQNSIFVLNTATTNNNNRLYYADSNDNTVVPPSTSSSVWSSASSNMCSPAAHAIQKLFNCSSNSLKFNHRNLSGIESKGFKSKSEILKKKTKFWKYLEAEANEQNNQRGIDGADANANARANEKKIFKRKPKYRSQPNHEKDTQEDLSELLEYSCSLCDNCRCMDCQISYFDCENSDDSNSEYSFNLSPYDDECDVYADESDCENVPEPTRELKSNENRENATRQLALDSKSPSGSNLTYRVSDERFCSKETCCQQCFRENIEGEDDDGSVDTRDQHDFPSPGDQ